MSPVEYSELAAYPLHGGVVVDWFIDAEPSGWYDDSRRLSTNHKSHLSGVLEHGEDPAFNWIGTVFRIPGTLDKEAFAQTLRLWFIRHDAYRTTALSADPDGTNGTNADLRRRTVSPEAISVRANEVAASMGEQFIHAHVNQTFKQRVSALQWPHIAIVTIEPEDAPAAAGEFFTVCFAADHQVMDAYTQLFAIAELIELYNSVRENRAPELPECGSYIEFSDDESRDAELITADHDAVASWRTYLNEVGDTGLDTGMPTFPLPLEDDEHPADHANPTQQASESRWVLNAEEAEAFAAYSKEHFGTSQSNSMLAAVKVALHRAGGATAARYIMPVHTRNKPEYAVAAGWFVGLTPVFDPLGEAKQFSEAVRDTSVAVKHYRPVVPFPYDVIREHLPNAGAPKFVVSFVDTRFVPGQDQWTEHERALRSPVRSDDDVYFWIVRSRYGVSVSTRYPANPVAVDSLARFFAEFEAIVHDVLERGDFPIIADA